MEPCAVCGKLTASRYGVCQRAGTCKEEWDRRYYAVNAASERERSRRYAAAHPESTRERKRREYVAGGDAVRERHERWRKENPEVARAIVKKAMLKYRQRPDRPCRYARVGCTEYAQTGRDVCPEHQRADGRRKMRRRRARLGQRLAVRQDWTCAWCNETLAEDLTGTHIDHIIPKASGILIEDEWNLQVLHDACNWRKADKITDLARVLAAQHGIGLPAAA